MNQFRVGIDIGGTFTDIVLIGADGTILTQKISSSVDDYSRSIADGLAALFQDTAIKPAQIYEIIHGTTVGSNAILELKGARTGLITTAGFRDVLELRTLRMPRLYDMAWEKPPALIERYLRRTVKERVDAAGRVQTPLEESEAEAVVDILLAEGVEAICVCLINSYLNPVHELQIKSIIERKAPDLVCCISFEVLPEIKEYERTSTTAINAYVMPVVAKYLKGMQRDLGNVDIRAPLLLMQSNGGIAPAEAISRKPANIIESGPAGGVIGAQALAQSIGLPSIITFDMGGTTAKASMIENGEVTRASEYSVGAGIMIGSRLLNGAGYLLKLPAIDLAEVGAGGGSIVRIDEGGALLVGPQSAGAMPGPVCYDLGGDEPTVTDSNLILGYINPEHLIGGGLKLNADKSRRIFQERIAGPLGLELAHAAYGAHQIAASNMIRAIKAVSTERGRDPRNFALFAFGGNGPIFAASMARALGIGKIVVPPCPGLFSSFGLLFAEVEHHYSRSYRTLTRNAELERLHAIFEEMESAAMRQLSEDGFSRTRAETRRTASMHYKGQTFALEIAVPSGQVTSGTVRRLEQAFAEEHLRTYGHRAGPEEPVGIVSLQVVGRGIPDRPRVPDRIEVANRTPMKGGGTRSVYFGPDQGWQEAPVMSRHAILGTVQGPCIIEEYDATCVIPPNASVCLDSYSNLAIDLAGSLQLPAGPSSRRGAS